MTSPCLPRFYMSHPNPLSPAMAPSSYQKSACLPGYACITNPTHPPPTTVFTLRRDHINKKKNNNTTREAHSFTLLYNPLHSSSTTPPVPLPFCSFSFNHSFTTSGHLAFLISGSFLCCRS